MTEASKLLPCPFCGGEPERFTINDDQDDPDNFGGDVIQSEACMASSHEREAERVTRGMLINMRHDCYVDQWPEGEGEDGGNRPVVDAPE